MEIVIQKFGGTSVASIEKLKQVASTVIESHNKHKHIVVILSAMAGETNKLIELANRASISSSPRELDILLATGEQKTVALLSMILHDKGFSAESLLFHQSGIITNSNYGNAQVTKIKIKKIKYLLENNIIPIIAGFQGCNVNGNVTTLGRGGSDLSAVALAAALNAKVCEIYTDVAGVYTADPNLCPKAGKINTISYDEMINLSNFGAKVMQSRSLKLAKKYKVKIHVRSSYSREDGTMIVSKKFDKLSNTKNSNLVSSVTSNLDYALITLRKLPLNSDITSSIFTPIWQQGIIIDIVAQNSWDNNYIDLTFTVPKLDYEKTMTIEKEVIKTIKKVEILGNKKIAQISVIVSTSRSSYGIIPLVFKILNKEKIKVFVISISKSRILCLIKEECAKVAVRTLHKAFGLDSEH